jgi:hypothetical protein
LLKERYKLENETLRSIVAPLLGARPSIRDDGCLVQNSVVVIAMSADRSDSWFREYLSEDVKEVDIQEQTAVSKRTKTPETEKES